MEIEILLDNHYMDVQIILENNYMEDDYMEIEIPLAHHDMDFFNLFGKRLHG